MRCGAVHHVVCWHSKDGCGSFECAPARRILSESRQPELRITRRRGRPGATSAAAGGRAGLVLSRQLGRLTIRWNLAAGLGWQSPRVIVAVAGIPLFGAVTGLIAILLGSLALGGIHHTRQRGTGLAVTGIVLGLADAVGWIAILASISAGGRSSHHQPGRVRAGCRRPEPHGARHRPQRPRQRPGGNQNRRAACLAAWASAPA